MHNEREMLGAADPYATSGPTPEEHVRAAFDAALREAEGKSGPMRPDLKGDLRNEMPSLQRILTAYHEHFGAGVKEYVRSNLESLMAGRFSDVRSAFKGAATVAMNLYSDKANNRLGLDGADGKIRWRLNGMDQGPWGIQLLPDRSLIAKDPLALEKMISDTEFPLDELTFYLGGGTESNDIIEENFDQVLKGLEANHGIKRANFYDLEGGQLSMLTESLPRTSIERIVVNCAEAVKLETVLEFLNSLADSKVKHCDLRKMQFAAGDKEGIAAYLQDPRFSQIKVEI